MVRLFFSEIHHIFASNSREIFDRDFGQELFFFRINFFNGRFRNRRRRRK